MQATRITSVFVVVIFGLLPCSGCFNWGHASASARAPQAQGLVQGEAEAAAG